MKSNSLYIWKKTWKKCSSLTKLNEKTARKKVENIFKINLKLFWKHYLRVGIILLESLELLRNYIEKRI